jgi:hypothetical protein
MSSFAQPTIAPKISVTAPTTSTAVCASGAPLKIAPERTMRYTPAVTIVAAWISAETGVGPSIASPSQDCSGTCADLPQAASSSIRPMAVSLPSPASPALESTGAKAKVPKVVNISMIAMDRPTSPTRLTMNAFFAAVAALGLCCQKPISRYEASPTPSQPTYSSRKLSASTSSSMAARKRFR